MTSLLQREEGGYEPFMERKGERRNGVEIQHMGSHSLTYLFHRMSTTLSMPVFISSTVTSFTKQLKHQYDGFSQFCWLYFKLLHTIPGSSKDGWMSTEQGQQTLCLSFYCLLHIFIFFLQLKPSWMTWNGCLDNSTKTFLLLLAQLGCKFGVSLVSQHMKLPNITRFGQSCPCLLIWQHQKLLRCLYSHLKLAIF